MNLVRSRILDLIENEKNQEDL
jgi:hypothetical protein